MPYSRRVGRSVIAVALVIDGTFSQSAVCLTTGP
jgi:hypothetical protein